MNYGAGFTVRVHRSDIGEVAARVKESLGESADFVKDVVFETLKAEGKEPKCDIGVILVSDNGIRALNKRYLEKDAATDILCFPYSGKPPYKCDMFISIETSFRQAEEFKHSHRRELAFLVAHGVLHLLGWQDHNPASRARMLARQSGILKKISTI